MILWLVNIDFAGGGAAPDAAQDWDIYRSMTLGYKNVCRQPNGKPCPVPRRRFSLIPNFVN